MKLYATLNSERAGREVKKGGDEMIRIELKRGNNYSYYIYFTPESLMVTKDDKQILVDTVEPRFITKTCNSCGSSDGRNNSSGEFQCNNCGADEEEE